MNQKVRQRATLSIKKDFYKLLNNSNFGIDCIFGAALRWFCRNSYIKKFTIFNDDMFRHFFSPSLLTEEISQTFQAKIFALNKEDSTYVARKKYYERQMVEELGGVDTYEKNKKAKKGNLKMLMQKLLIVSTHEKQ